MTRTVRRACAAPACSAAEQPQEQPLDRIGHRGEPAVPVAGRALDPAEQPLGDEEREHRSERVRRPVDHEPRALGDADETRPGVAPVVSRLDVVVGPGPLVRGNRQQHPAPRAQHAGQLGHGQRLALAVLDHVERRHHVERVVREGQRLGGPAHALAGSESAGEQVQRDPAVAALHPADARAVGAAHVEDRGRSPEVRPQDRVQQLGAGAEPPVVRLVQGRGAGLCGWSDHGQTVADADTEARKVSTTRSRSSAPSSL